MAREFGSAIRRSRAFRPDPSQQGYADHASTISTPLADWHAKANQQKLSAQRASLFQRRGVLMAMVSRTSAGAWMHHSRFPVFAAIFSSAIFFSFIIIPVFVFSKAPEPRIITLLLMSAFSSLLFVFLKNYTFIFFNSVVFFLLLYPFYLQGFFRFRYLLGGRADVEAQTLFLFGLFLTIVNVIGLFGLQKEHVDPASREYSETTNRRMGSLRATVLSMVFLILVLILFGYEQIFFSRQRSFLYGVEPLGSFEKFFIGIMKTVPYWLLYFYIVTHKDMSKMKFILGALPVLCIALIISNPINTQRFLSLFGLLVIFFALIRRGNIFALWRNSYAVVAAGLIILPITSSMRSGGISLEFVATSLFSLEFSAFSLLNDLFLISYRASGEPVRLLSAVLIFVPRALWPSKNEGTGQAIAEAAGYWWHNVGIPPIADAYLDFGIAGVVLLAVVAGFALRGASNFLSAHGDGDSLTGMKISFIALIPIFLRGDLSTALIAFYTSMIAFYIARGSCRLRF